MKEVRSAYIAHSIPSHLQTLPVWKVVLQTWCKQHRSTPLRCLCDSDMIDYLYCRPWPWKSCGRHKTRATTTRATKSSRTTPR